MHWALVLISVTRGLTVLGTQEQKKTPEKSEVKVMVVFTAAVQHCRSSFVMRYGNLFIFFVESTVSQLVSLF